MNANLTHYDSKGEIMTNINLTVPHALSRDEALGRIKQLMHDVKNRYAGTIQNLTEEWTDNIGTFGFSAMGLPITGTLTVMPAHVEIAGDLPLTAVPFKGMIETTLRERAISLLA